ncbi:Sphingoid base-phosphate phosphatase [Phaffia rhodozyma]|uniref:Sphingoid base-phosphate phosphatase n=1 Tax=Phaffia rhodozyma TaxID=264483 RepID=A0A0F7SJ88_PHARH|nr:Sphingoid base-phosphate phosphatase [Phaffia rhodozyma]
MNSASSSSSSSSLPSISVNLSNEARFRNSGHITGQPLSSAPEPISSERMGVSSSETANGSSARSKTRETSKRLSLVQPSSFLPFTLRPSPHLSVLSLSLSPKIISSYSQASANAPYTLARPMPAVGRELVLVLAAGIYFSSLVKDLVQVPRPSCPPATRLSLEYHALEYGFPSSHCTSTTSLAIYYFIFLSRFEVESSWLWFGGGSAYLTELFHPFLEAYLVQPTALVPFTLILGTTVLAGIRPEPELPCPCFGDAIAFFSVAVGTSLARWLETKISGDQWDTIGTVDRWSEVKRGDGSGRLSGWEGWLVWGLLIGGKYMFGIAVIILYRLFAKLSLPLVYRALLGPSSDSAPVQHKLLTTPSTSASSSLSLSSNPTLNRPSIPSPARTLSTESNSSHPDINLIPSVVDLGALNEPVVKSEPKDHMRGRTSRRESGVSGGADIVVEGEDGEEVKWQGSRSTGSQGEGEFLKSTREGFFAAFIIPLIFITSGIGLHST